MFRMKQVVLAASLCIALVVSGTAGVQALSIEFVSTSVDLNTNNVLFNLGERQ